MAFQKLWPLLLLAVCSSENASRIAGGNDITIDYYSSTVQVDMLLGIFWSQSCAGTILTSRYILSAASCFSGTLFNPRFRRVRAGTTYRNSGGQVVNVQEAINHPDFGLNGRDSDITVVRLAEYLIYDPLVQQGTVVAPGTDLPDYLPLIQVGWGATTEELASQQLQEVSVYTLNREACAAAYQELNEDLVVTENMLCTGTFEGGRGACSGDGGGPTFYDNDGNLIVVGVISFQEGCGNATFPSVNTAVSPFTNWIIETAN